MAGNLPFDEPSLPVLFKKIAKADYPVPTWFSPDMISLFKSMLNPNPQKRCATLLQLSSLLHCFQPHMSSVMVAFLTACLLFAADITDTHFTIAYSTAKTHMGEHPALVNV